MSKRNILVLDAPESLWPSFLQEFFEDTQSAVHVFSDPQSAGAFADQTRPDLGLINPAYVSQPFQQKLKFLRGSRPGFRLIRLGTGGGELVWDADFPGPPSLSEFQKTLSECVDLPEQIDVLVVDDEPEIGGIIRDYLSGRVRPSFWVRYAGNGAEGLAAIRSRRPDVLILDVKMPVKDGREVYREICEKGWDLPVIIFFDAISGDEIAQLRQWGRPAIVEKGAPRSAMPEMMTLIKKRVYFG